jgi:hypothetical protein
VSIGLPEAEKGNQSFNAILTIVVRVTKYAYNNSRSSVTGRSLNYFMFGFDCSIRLDVADNIPRGRIPAALDRVTKLHQLREDLRDKLLAARERMKRYYDARHTPKQFKRGDFVKLSTANLKLKSGKLRPRWVGPFRVLERIGGQAYRLALPAEYSRLHDVFPIQLLEAHHPRDPKNLLPMPELEEEQEEWEVEEVRGVRKQGQQLYYLVKWAGWPSEYNSYEPAEHLANAQGAVRQFERQRKRKR